MIQIDGSYGEGGGQIVRMSVALSAVTGKPIEVYNIRKNRPKTGLSHQHVVAVKCAKEMCSAECEGLELHSKRLKFVPGEIHGGKYRISPGTAGSVTLILQLVGMLSFFSKKNVILDVSGGTDVKWAPTISYYKNVFLKNLKKIGMNADIEIESIGFYPKGGGRCIMRVRPSSWEEIVLEERGDLISISGEIVFSMLPQHIPSRIKKSFLSHVIKMSCEKKYGIRKHHLYALVSASQHGQSLKNRHLAVQL